MRSEDRATPRINKCSACIERNADCYHYDVVDHERLQAYKDKVKDLEDLHPYLKGEISNEGLRLDPTAVGKTSNISNIEFDSSDHAALLEFSGAINKDLVAKALEHLFACLIIPVPVPKELYAENEGIRNLVSLKVVYSVQINLFT